MEALAVVSLTGNILQFIEVTSKLISSTHQVFSAGSKPKYIELETIAKELRRVAEAIRSQQPTSDSNEEPDMENPLVQISAQCIDITDQLLAVLDSVKLKDGSNKLRSFYQVLKSEWKSDEIEALQKRVERIGQDLNTHLMASQQRQISRKLDQLAAANRRLEAGRTQDIRDLKGQLKSIFKDLREELLQDESNYVPSSAIFLQLAEKGAQYSAEQIVLEKFRFNAIDDRYEGIPSAHRNTFSWIFAPQTDSTAPLPSFAQWLTSADDLYWISGKPGSGKSTLIKYLCTHEETKRKLQDWAHDNPLVLAGFFFWSAGKKTLQKSQQGLLRSLIYQILRRCPELIQQIYPEIGRSQTLGRSGDDQDEGALQAPNPPTSVPGLLAILRNACDLLTSSHARLCFFIDGLDEYEGKPGDIIELIGILKSLPNVKICASSRPWNEFEHCFGQAGSQKLYMQDLTKNDIHNYVCDILENDENYQCLEEKDEQGAQLIHEIIEAAQGVFLWVVLVVRSFQEGLTNGDRIVDLQKRLRQLPRDLNEYFEKILLSDVSEFYRLQSARIFAATLKAQERLPLMAYWYMDQEDPNYAFDLDIEPLSLQKMSMRLKQTRKRLNACCKGLLEVHFLSKDADLDILPSSILFIWKVDFLHRTVKDFLISPETKAFLSRWSPQQNLDSDMGICTALLSQIKTVPQECEYFELLSGVPALLTLLLMHARVLDESPGCEFNSLVRLLDQVDATLVDHDQKVGHGVYRKVLWAVFYQEESKQPFDLMRNQVTFLHVCVKFGLSRYAENKLNSCSLPGDASTRELSILLRIALKATDHAMVRLLLRKGADPNASVKGGTNWTLLLGDICERNFLTLVPPGPNDPGLFPCIQDLLEHGADPQAIISFHSEPFPARKVLERRLIPEYMALIEIFFVGLPEGYQITPKVSISGDSQGAPKEQAGAKRQKRQKSSIRQYIMAKLERLGHWSG
ncbi:hypothetical protein DL771_008469 [Monosporascus sp. 5C6A]|nr:hypothetical protein DL771_008469 [Monosporascus sp. 5C6A]